MTITCTCTTAAVQVRRGPRAGRIPGAVSLPRKMLLADDGSGMLLPLEQQRQLLEQAGVQLPPPGGETDQQQQQQRVVLFCNGGVAACTAALALHRLGHRHWSVYDGSWWVRRTIALLHVPMQTRRECVFSTACAQDNETATATASASAADLFASAHPAPMHRPPPLRHQERIQC